jgi:hypothetical protein
MYHVHTYFCGIMLNERARFTFGQGWVGVGTDLEPHDTKVAIFGSTPVHRRGEKKQNITKARNAAHEDTQSLLLSPIFKIEC